jgi:Skp family chaperone for outer membrane proteins
MNFIKYFNIFLVIFLLINNIGKANSAESIVYIDLDILMKNSLVGKSLIKKLEIYKNDNNNKFKKIIEIIKSKEKKIISQKNVIDSGEFQKKMKDLNIEFREYKESINKFNSDINELKFSSEQSIMKVLTPILTEYSKNNSTSMILNKRNIIIAKTELDITDFIIIELNKKIKEIEIKK